jgi:hypothetical protein
VYEDVSVNAGHSAETLTQRGRGFCAILLCHYTYRLTVGKCEYVENRHGRGQSVPVSGAWKVIASKKKSSFREGGGCSAPRSRCNLRPRRRLCTCQTSDMFHEILLTGPINAITHQEHFLARQCRDSNSELMNRVETGDNGRIRCGGCPPRCSSAARDCMAALWMQDWIGKHNSQMRRNREERGREATLCLYVDNGRTVPVQRCGSQALSELYHAMWDTDFEVQTPANICWPGRPEIQRLKAKITLSIIWGGNSKEHLCLAAGTS